MPSSRSTAALQTLNGSKKVEHWDHSLAEWANFRSNREDRVPNPFKAFTNFLLAQSVHTAAAWRASGQGSCFGISPGMKSCAKTAFNPKCHIAFSPNCHRDVYMQFDTANPDEPPPPSRKVSSPLEGTKTLASMSPSASFTGGKNTNLSSHSRDSGVLPGSQSGACEDALDRPLIRWAQRYFSLPTFVLVHAGAALAPFYFTEKALLCFVLSYILTQGGITLGYHRQLSHQSFRSPKWLEYLAAYCGSLALQGPPIEWVSDHRCHHANTDTHKDVHSPLRGFWWAHMGWIYGPQGRWLLTTEEKSRVADLESQKFYRFLQNSYPLHFLVFPILCLQAIGGLPCVIWAFFVRIVCTWHVTFCVNSLCHMWGRQTWKTNDKSVNNWIIGLLCLGEGFHNNHHAFSRSCRHGLMWWQIDITWYFLKLLEFIGLAWDLNYPSKTKMSMLRRATADGSHPKA